MFAPDCQGRVLCCRSLSHVSRASVAIRRCSSLLAPRLRGAQKGARNKDMMLEPSTKRISREAMNWRIEDMIFSHRAGKNTLFHTSASFRFAITRLPPSPPPRPQGSVLECPAPSPGGVFGGTLPAKPT